MNWFKFIKAQFDSQIENHDQQPGDSFSTDPSIPLSQSPNDLDFNGLKNQPFGLPTLPSIPAIMPNPKLDNKFKLAPKGNGKGIRKHKGKQIWRHAPNGAHIPNTSNDPSQLESLTEKLNSPPSPMFI